MDEELELKLLSFDPDISKQSAKRLADLREKRDSGAVKELLDELSETAESTRNLMPVLIRCVEGYCTLGEIAGALRQVWGEYRPEGRF
jgi:methylmalonyl-CoA mutase N-terminal domain/subunit